MSSGSCRARALGLVALLLSVSFVGACGGSGSDTPTAEDLKPFAADGFSVELPGTPQRSEEPVPGSDLKLVFYSVDANDEYYAISVVDVPEGTPLDVDGAVEGSAANIGGTVAEKVPVQVDVHDAMDARITGAKSNGIEGTAFTRVIATPTRLYQILTIERGADERQNVTHDRIVASFKLD